MSADVFDVPLEHLPYVWPVVFSFGGGLNSTAELVEWAKRGYPPPDLIQFSDTGAETELTYENVRRVSDWLVVHGMPPVTWTRKGGRQETIVETCLRLGVLPSMAYGKKACSHKFKIEPQERDVNRWPVARRAWKRGEKVVKLIGYGYEEQRRISLAKIEDEKYFYRFPLNEWRIDRQGCVDIIESVGLPIPPKSSCYICPSMTKPEIANLQREHPVLFMKALAVEQRAKDAGKLRTVQGLGRKFAWADFAAGLPTADAPVVNGCMYCVDDSPEVEQAELEVGDLV